MEAKHHSDSIINTLSINNPIDPFMDSLNLYSE